MASPLVPTLAALSVISPQLAACFERDPLADLTLIEECEDAAIADQLSRRLGQGRNMYASIGEKVLVSVNPYQLIERHGESIYCEAVMLHYAASDPLELQPHVFFIASASFHEMIRTLKPQCVIISGESGAGKTEAAKQIMQFVTTISKRAEEAPTNSPALQGDQSIFTPVSAIPAGESESECIARRLRRAVSKVDAGLDAASLSRRASQRTRKSASPRASQAGASSLQLYQTTAGALGASPTFEQMLDLPEIEEGLVDQVLSHEFLEAVWEHVQGATDEVGGNDPDTVTLEQFDLFLRIVQVDTRSTLHNKRRGGPGSGGDEGYTESYHQQRLSLLLSEEDALGDVNLKASLVDVKKQLLESNPVLEAFGNAQTIRNDNSSRFGKYVEIQFDHGGKVLGGRLTNFLLERSRVVSQHTGERNFHIFHLLCAGASDREREDFLLAASPEEYRYMAGTVAAVNAKPGARERDAEQFQALRESLRVVGISDVFSRDIFRCVAGILMLGQVDFVDQGDDAAATVSEESAQALHQAALLFKVAPDLLVHNLTHHRIVAGGEEATKTLTALEAADSRDSLAKETYGRVFQWLVTKINRAVEASASGTSIGILDIFGFEVFEENSLQQLCINYANEKLQHLFIELTLKAEQEEYEREGVDWNQITFFDNQIVCELIDGTRPGGLFALLDEQCAFREPTVDSLLASYTRNLGDKHTRFVQPETYLKTGRVHVFGVEHYAGNVQYQAASFLEQNTDTLYTDLIQAMSTSTSALIRKLFEDRRTDAEKAKRPPTMSTQFTGQVAKLMGSLLQCEPHYVRCIKPNDDKAAFTADAARMVHQVQYLGLRENVLVRRQGFSFRTTLEHFVRRYSLISELTWPAGPDARDAVRKILTGGQPRHWRHVPDQDPFMLNEQEKEFVLGETKVFVREPQHVYLLEERRTACLPAIVRLLQAAVRRFVYRNIFLRTIRGFVVLEAQARRYVARRKYLRTLFRLVRVQALVRRFIGLCRMRAMRQQFHNKPPRYWATLVQRRFRGHLARKALDAAIADRLALARERIATSVVREEAVNTIAAQVRGRQARQAYAKTRWAVLRAQVRIRMLLARVRLRRLLDEEHETVLGKLHADAGGWQMERWTRGSIFVSPVLKDFFLSLSADNTQLTASKSKHFTLSALSEMHKETGCLHASPVLAAKVQPNDDAELSRYLVLAFADRTLDLKLESAYWRDALHRSLTRLTSS